MVKSPPRVRSGTAFGSSPMWGMELMISVREAARMNTTQRNLKDVEDRSRSVCPTTLRAMNTAAKGVGGAADAV